MTVEWEKVYVFISSTFNDMHAERDYLVKRVFPELRDWCERRRLRLVDVDLRWGVTEEDATANADVVQTCLKRIDDCRPFFICLLGQRYGWRPGREDISDETFAVYPGVEEAIADGESVTEMEILHAIVSPLGSPSDNSDAPDLAEDSFFYLREDSYLRDVPKKPPRLHRTYTDDVEDDPEERTVLQRKLRRLRKVTIPATERPVRDYRASWDADARTPETALPLDCPALLEDNVRRWQEAWEAALAVEAPVTWREVPPELRDAAADYNARLTQGRLTGFRCNGEELGGVILDDLKGAIARRYPEHTEVAEEAQDDLQRELDQHAFFVGANLDGFVGRREDLDALYTYVRDNDRRLFVLAGEAGMGKSMLLAKWVDRCRRHLERFPDAVLLARFVGQSDGSDTVEGLLTYLLRELQAVGRLPRTQLQRPPSDEEGPEMRTPLNIPADPRQLRAFWREWLGKLDGEKTIIVIDGLNQLQGGLHDLAWLPTGRLPANVKLVISLRDYKARDYEQAVLDDLRQNAHAVVRDVPPFDDPDDRRKLVAAYLSQYLKELDQHHVEQLIGVSGASNPLTLNIVLSELRVFGSFPQLGEKIENDFGETPLSAFQAVLKRLEHDPGYTEVDPRQGVPLLFGLLAHARHGLSTDELTDLFVKNLGVSRRQDAQEAVQLLLRQARPFMARREGRYRFLYNSFWRASRQRYVGKAQGGSPKRSEKAWHGLLADYFADLPLSNRHKLAELPYQQARARRWQDLKATLTDLDFLMAKLQRIGLQPLIADCDSARYAGYREWDLRLLRETFVLSAHALSRDPTQLVGHLLGRLGTYGTEYPALEHLLQQASSYSAAPALLPTAPLLRPAGGPLVWQLTGELPSVERLAVSPDRTRIVASGASTHVEAWDARSGLRLFQAEGHSEHVEAIAFTDDGRFLLTGSREPRARLEERDGQLVSTGSGEPEGVRILVRDARTCAPIQSHTMAQRLARAKSLSLAPGGRHLVTVDWLRGLATTINVWDPQTGCALGALYEGRESADVLAFSPDGRYCLVALSDNTARLWDLAKRRPIVQLTFKAPVSAGAVSSEGKYVALLVAGPGRGSYRLYVADATRRALLRTIGWREHQHRPNRLTGKDRAAFSPDGGMLVSTADGTLKMWNWAKEKLVCQLAAAGPVTFNKDGRYLYAGAGSQVKVWSFERLLRRPPPVAPTKNAVEALASTPDGGQVAAGSRDGVVSIWDPRTERRLRTLEADSLRVTALTFSPDGALLASASDDRTVRIWDVEASCLIQTITREDINSMAFGQERKTLITAKHSFSGRPVIDAWDVRSGEKLGAPLPLRTQRVYARLNPRGDRVLIIDHGDTGTACLELWDRRRQRQLWRCCEPRVDRRAVAFTPEGRHIVARDRKGRIVTFDASTGQVDQVFPRDPLMGWGPCFLDVSTDGALILGAGAKTLTLWDRRTGRRVASFSSDKRMVPCRVLHLPSGYLIAAGGEQLRFLKLVGYAVQSR